MSIWGMSLSFPTVAGTFHHCVLPYLGDHLLHVAAQGPGDAVGTAHRPACSSKWDSPAVPLPLQPQRHRTASDLACFSCSWCWHFKLSQREVTTIPNFTYKQWSPWKSGVVCCTAQRSPVSFEGLINSGINPQLLAQGPDHRFIHSFIFKPRAEALKTVFSSHSFMSRLGNLQGADDFLQMQETLNNSSSLKPFLQI